MVKSIQLDAASSCRPWRQRRPEKEGVGEKDRERDRGEEEEKDL